jgi:hypothetical protein
MSRAMDNSRFIFLRDVSLLFKTPYTLVCGYQFSDKLSTSIIRVEVSSTLKIEVCSSETLVMIYRATLLYNPEDRTLDVLLFEQNLAQSARTRTHLRVIPQLRVISLTST